MNRILCSVILFASACGGGEGVGIPGDTPYVDLDENQTTALCERFVDILGPVEEITCEDGDTAEVGADAEDLAECIDDLSMDQASSPDCPVTVDQYQDCIEAIAGASDAEVCAGEFPAACAVLDNPDC